MFELHGFYYFDGFQSSDWASFAGYDFEGVTTEPQGAPPPPPTEDTNSADPARFTAMLNAAANVNYSAAPEVYYGADQGSGDGGIDFDFAFAINMAVSAAWMNSSPNQTVVNQLQAANIPFQVTLSGQIYVPSLGGYAVPASSGIGVPIGGWSGGYVSTDPTEIVVTALAYQHQGSGLVLNPFTGGIGLPSAATTVTGGSETLFVPQIAVNSVHPEGFNEAQDEVTDRLADQIGREIMSKLDFAIREYGAVIWVDRHGVVHRTSLATGTASNTPLSEVWGQIDFANGGRIVATIHSHPTTYLAGMLNGAPMYLPALQAGTLSSIDFDSLMGTISGSVTISGTTYNMTRGYDTVNYRSYLVSGNGVREFYASDQNPSYVGAGAQATWAIQSSDYLRNTTTPPSPPPAP